MEVVARPGYIIQEWWTTLVDILNESFTKECTHCDRHDRWYEYVAGNALDGQAVIGRCRNCGGETVILARSLSAPFIPPYGGLTVVDVPRLMGVLETMGIPRGALDPTSNNRTLDPRWRGWLPFPVKGKLRRSPQHRYVAKSVRGVSDRDEHDEQHH